MSRSFPLPASIFPDIKTDTMSESTHIRIEFDVHFGVIQDVRVQLPLDHFDPLLDLSEAIHGLPFGQDVPQAVSKALELQPMVQEKKEFIYNCVQAMIGKFV